MQLPASVALSMFGSLVSATSTFSDELKIFTARAISTVLEVVAAGIQVAMGGFHISGCLAMLDGDAVEFLKRIDAGDPFDVLGACAYHDMTDRLLLDTIHLATLKKIENLKYFRLSLAKDAR